MTALLEPARDHDCQCGAQARLWVDIGVADPQPCCRACAARAASDPAFREALAATHSEPCEDVLPPFRSSKPVVSPQQQQSKAAAAMVAALAADPQLRQKFVEIGRKVASMRRRCLGPKCGLVTGAGPLGAHQKATGHTGWEAVR
jgi:hypothetical protein